MTQTKKYERVILGLTLLAGSIAGMFPADSSQAQAIGVFFAVPMVILLYAWCRAHGKQHGLETLGLYAVLFALLPVLGVPLYFFRFFGWKKGTIKLANAILFFMMTVVVYVFSAELVHAVVMS